ncbi:hypothetical protein [Vibrio penaeicida]|uniref:Uncharacterized protein n=1 Tax=Vibrio penaeicida TaxID=104609 RepID=A0AAV5NTY0_9VIBR|nr:hypothetical protein [Vibrio penaeicida]RTZ18737.1 hypothetical protein EKN09_29165 [Vibrio penaeicida]GLQ73744.1 hypothetical protein GCM10007932_31040 [Vibrio penaeicida]
MTEWSAEQYCNTCRKTTSHTETLVRKPSSYDSDTSLLGRIKLSLHTIINGGSYYDMDRYVTCKTCHTKELKNQGNEFE